MSTSTRVLAATVGALAIGTMVAGPAMADRSNQTWRRVIDDAGAGPMSCGIEARETRVGTETAKITFNPDAPEFWVQWRGVYHLTRTFTTDRGTVTEVLTRTERDLEKAPTQTGPGAWSNTLRVTMTIRLYGTDGQLLDQGAGMTLERVTIDTAAEELRFEPLSDSGTLVAYSDRWCGHLQHEIG